MILNHKIYAVPYQILFQEAYSPSMEGIINFHHDIMVWLIIIIIFIFWIMCQMILRFNSFKNSYPEELDHNVSLWLEIIWTILPVFILVSISIPSFSLLYSLDEVLDCVLTIKVTGSQWYWEYEYPEMDIQNISNDPFIFQSYMIQEEDLAFGELRLLEVDRRVVIPSNHHVRFIVTSSDVIHSWAIPSLGVKMDACPGRLNQVHLFCNQPGIYYGQCSEICGVNHGFMPIVVEALPMDDFLDWYSLSSVEDLGLADSYLQLSKISPPPPTPTPPPLVIIDYDSGSKFSIDDAWPKFHHSADDDRSDFPSYEAHHTYISDKKKVEYIESNNSNNNTDNNNNTSTLETKKAKGNRVVRHSDVIQKKVELDHGEFVIYDIIIDMDVSKLEHLTGASLRKPPELVHRVNVVPVVAVNPVVDVVPVVAVNPVVDVVPVVAVNPVVEVVPVVAVDPVVDVVPVVAVNPVVDVVPVVAVDPVVDVVPVVAVDSVVDVDSDFIDEFSHFDEDIFSVESFGSGSKTDDSNSISSYSSSSSTQTTNSNSPSPTIDNPNFSHSTELIVYDPPSFCFGTDNSQYISGQTSNSDSSGSSTSTETDDSNSFCSTETDDSIFSCSTQTDNSKAKISRSTQTDDSMFSGSTKTVDSKVSVSTQTDDSMFSGSTQTDNSKVSASTQTDDSMFPGSTQTDNSKVSCSTQTDDSMFSSSTQTGDSKVSCSTQTDDSNY